MKVSTWADGFGNWHALVTEQGIGDAQKAERRARYAIITELSMREGPKFDPERMTVRQVSRTSRDGELMTEFVEQWPED
ncbi:hypothetical protein [Kribbella sindirgiensis]|uniref:Uncharacterized protein n=1 Tax=Kribbella sindirgiensis TaxID=1124744 RepID=A0A4R0I660_9ACTN|nr:hypothetical protein [Kribbella sindirgiensis]TCC19945.1 hypothetical protein E0H50_37580 [Kribbella sindirgiensis]